MDHKTLLVRETEQTCRIVTILQAIKTDKICVFNLLEI